MAVENKYTNADVAAGKLTSASSVTGDKDVTIFFNFEVAAADDNGSVYRIAKSVNSNSIVKEITLFNDAITAATDYDIGLYETTGEDGVDGPVIDKDVYLDGEDISSGNARASAVNGLTAIAIENIDKTIYENGGATLETKKRNYDIAITANVVGTAAGTISGYIVLVQK